MTGDTPRKKRDRFLLDPLKKLAGRSPSPGAALQTNLVQPITTSPQTNDPFLQDALNMLSEEERSVIQKHVASDIGTTVEAAYVAAADRKSFCEQKRWPISDKADKVLLWLDRFKSVGDIIANADPIHVGLPWAGIRFLLDVFVADSRQMSALISGMDLALSMANRLRAYFTYYQRLPRAQTTDYLRKRLITLYAHTLRFLAEAIQVYSESVAARKAKAFWRDSNLTNFENECDRLAARADIEVTNCDRDLLERNWTAAAQWKNDLTIALHEINDIQQQVVKKLDDLHVKADLSKLIVVPEAIYNSSSNENVSICLEGTRLDILDSIQRWVDMPEGKFIFWLRGMAGTGKSTISRTVAQRYDQP